MLLEQVHLPADRFPGLLASDLEHNSLYGLLTERYGTRVVRAREAIEPILLRGREAALLGQPSGRPACRRRSSSADGSPSNSPGASSAATEPATTAERVVAPPTAPGRASGLPAWPTGRRAGESCVRPDEGRERRHPSPEAGPEPALPGTIARSAAPEPLRALPPAAVLIVGRGSSRQAIPPPPRPAHRPRRPSRSPAAPPRPARSTSAGIAAWAVATRRTRWPSRRRSSRRSTRPTTRST
jgi:hypothetical protein